MLKRMMAAMLGIAMAANMVACGCGTANNGDEAVENAPQDTTVVEESAAPEETTPATEETQNQVSGETVGNLLLQDFHNKKAENPEISAQEMADAILSSSIIQFEGASMAVEEGLLTGFGNAEITGFKEAVMFAPMIGTIPFVGYVFTLDEGVDADAFINLLKENADPRWNICTEAEETVVENADNMVFFVMCPAQFE